MFSQLVFSLCHLFVCPLGFCRRVGASLRDVNTWEEGKMGFWEMMFSMCDMLFPKIAVIVLSLEASGLPEP